MIVIGIIIGVLLTTSFIRVANFMAGEDGSPAPTTWSRFLDATFGREWNTPEMHERERTEVGR